MSAAEPQFRIAADALATEHDSDVLFVNAPLYRDVDGDIIQLCRSRSRRHNVLLILVTTGGDADVAFRIARCLQSSYEKFTMFVSGYCKSAGTLLALGARELVISDFGELGPLDVQMSKPDELLQRQSGLTATAALSTLHEQAFKAYEHFLLETVTSGGEAISTKTATHIAAQLTVGLFSKIYEHVDPMHVGESGRMLRIAEKYGRMLSPKSGNFSEKTLMELTSGYPSHGFVIDRVEATRLFQSVREPNALETALENALGDRAVIPGSQRLVAYLSSEMAAPLEAQQTERHHAATAPVSTTSTPPPGRPVGNPQSPADDDGQPVPGSGQVARGGDARSA